MAVTTAFTTLFDGTAPLAQRLSYLQNASAFQQALDAQRNSPLISQTSATVGAVTLRTPTQADVVFTVALSGTPLLKNQTGTAVQIGGSWKVAATTLCSLLTAAGQAPTACTQVATTALPS
jgi:hypothetical protein